MSKIFITCLIFFLAGGSIVPEALAQDPERFRDTIDEFKKSDLENPPPDNILLFVGSSSIRQWKELENDFPDHDVLNRGFGGSHFSDAVYYAEDLFFKYDPLVIFIYEGDNDIASGKETGKILDDAGTLLELIRKQFKYIPVAFISPKPSVSRWHLKEKYESLNSKLRSWTENTPNVHYIDVWKPMLNTSGKPKPEIFLEDNLHMHRKGYRIWKNEVKEFLHQLGQK